MLPDLPKIKIELEKKVIKRMQNAEKASIVSEFKKSRMFEGKNSKIYRDDGIIDEVKMRKHGIEISLKFKEIENSSPEEILKKIDKAGAELTAQKTKTMFDKIGNVAKSVGNEFSLKGQKFNLEHFFKAMEKIYIDFDKNENPILPTFVGPTNFDFDVLKKLESDDEAKQKYEEIIRIKKDEWRARENSRKLVG